MRKKRNKKNQLFISHCSDDRIIMESLSKLLQRIIDTEKTDVFNSSDNHGGIIAGKNISDLRNELKESELMLAIITDSYERSLKCIAELSSFWYTEKPVIPIIFNDEKSDVFLDEMMLKSVISINVKKDKPELCALRLVDSLYNYGIGFILSKEEVQAEFTELFKSVNQNTPKKKFIGSTENYDAILAYCENYGIKQLINDVLSPQELINNLKDSKKIYIISTTGAGLIERLHSSGYLKKALSEGTEIYVVLANRYSPLCYDVAEIETPLGIDINLERISNGFSDVMANLQSSLNIASNESEGVLHGKIYVCCAYTLIRQTLTISVKNDDSVWGWMSVTIPPMRTNSGTPSLEFQGTVNDKTMANIALTHAEAMVRVARDRGGFVELIPFSSPPKQFFFEDKTAYDHWKKLYEEADKKMLSRKSNGTETLIEIAAQHPLRDGKPDKEFEKRLDFGIELYKKEKECSNCVKIYVPGSLHKDKGVLDAKSLSAAGKEYLLENGIPEQDILGENENEKFKGEDGVYNSADECYVASMIFLNGNYKKLICVCSPNQMVRKQLFYIAFGVIPHFYTVPCDVLAHNPIYELFESVPDVIYNDNTWQESNSKHALSSRSERKPCEEELLSLKN